MAADKVRKKLLGEYLVDQGLVSEDQIIRALDEQKKAGSRLGQTLIDLGFLSEEEMIIALAKQLDLAHIDILNYTLKSDVVNLIPEKIARRYELIALDKMGDSLTIAMADPLNVFAIDEVSQLTRSRIDPVICSRTKLLKIFDKAYNQSISDTPESIVSTDKYTRHQAEDKEGASLGGAEIIDLVNEILQMSVSARATDIHIEPDEEEIRIRCRIDGLLTEMKNYPKEVQLPIISRIKVLSGLDISEKRIPQDGRFKFLFEEREIDLRVSTLPTVLGEKIVLRVLDKSMVVMDMNKLGFLPENLEQLQDLIHRPYGMLLVTGPTSSGKTTTLYSALNTINTIEKNILTVEDPVEYRLKMINQVQINPRAGLTFAAGLRSFLRQDPNVIMIGEIRDLETAEIAVQSALTGHLVLSTIHTNNAPSTINRLIDMKIDAFLVASAVTGVLAQRLIRTICPGCKQPFTPDAGVVQGLNLPVSEKGYTFYKGIGCDACGGTGYKGRIGIYEMMIINNSIRELILRHASTDELTQTAKKNGMKTLREDGFQKVLNGVTTVEEVLRATAEEAKG
ncbi:MAG: ATPase, T2SS/T4P/T4SS family [Candidatus Omnitrophota bacterium]